MQVYSPRIGLLHVAGFHLATVSALAWLFLYNKFDSYTLFLECLFAFIFLTLFSALIQKVQKYYHSKNVINIPNVGLIIFFGLLVTLSLIGIEKIALNNSFASAMNEAKVFIFKSIMSAFLLGISLIIFWIERQKEEENRLRNYSILKERESADFELRSLEKQWQPHFLFNSLNSISALTLSKPDEARKMIQLLSEFMRNSVRNDQNELITIEEEISYLKLYTDIEKVRFGDRLKVEYNISDSTEGMVIPRLTLQPLIENAVKYGLYGSTTDVTIRIEVVERNNNLQITMTNPFDVEGTNSSKGTGFGLNSVNKKLFLIFKKNNLLTTEIKEGEFISKVTVPQ